jgi:hypothetical protein
VLELTERRNDRLHASRCLCERILDGSDRRKDLSHSNHEIRSNDDPNVEVGGVREFVCGLASRGVDAGAETGGTLVDVGLKDGGVDHGEASDEEASVDTLDGCEVDVTSAEGWVDDIVEDGHHDDDSNGVEVPKWFSVRKGIKEVKAT